MMQETNPLLRKLLVTGIRQETDSVRSLQLMPADGQPMPYQAGQFITLDMPGPGGNQVRRSYSLASCPEAGEPMMITVRRIANGLVSRQLCDHTHTGDVLMTTGVAGRFTLDAAGPALSPTRLFLAAGIGIVPIYALIHSLMLRDAGARAVLIYSNRSLTDTVFYQKLEALKQAFAGRLQIEYLLSTARDLSRARLNKWLLPALLAEYIDVPYQKLGCFICGPMEYMRMASLGLQELGVPASGIRQEQFQTNMPRPALRPPSEAPRQVRVLLQGKTYQFTIRWPDTILSGARKAGITLPYSCGNGRCSSCIAHCSSGRVWHAHNEVLTDAEVAAGLVLPCTAYPIDASVTLDYDIT